MIARLAMDWGPSEYVFLMMKLNIRIKNVLHQKMKLGIMIRNVEM